MAHIIEVNKRDVSQYAETCGFKDEPDHECDEQCRYMDGDVREIRDHGQSDYAYDSDDAEEHGTPVAWAISYLGGQNFPDLHNGSSCHDGKRGEREWLSANDPHPYEEHETEWSVYLRGDWTEEERFQIFAAVGS